MFFILLLGFIGLLLFLITVLRLNAFIALTIVAFSVGLLKGMNLEAVVKSVEAGIGGTLGGLVLVLGFGVILGSVLAETGAAQQISDSLVRIFGQKRAKIAILLTGFLVGLAMFYNAGFVVLIPLVFLVSVRSGMPLVYLGIAMASALSVTHGFLPPHPGPTAIVKIFNADMGKTLVLGLGVSIFALLFAGIIFPEFIKKIKANPPEGLVQTRAMAEAELPPFGSSLLIALTPVLLMATATISELVLPEQSSLLQSLKFLGNPSVSMLIGVLLALVFLAKTYGPGWRQRMDDMMAKNSKALSAATMILMITAAGGAFKQVLTDSGIGKEIAEAVSGGAVPPLVLGWLVATLVRISIGSATLAGLMAAGIVQPVLIANPDVSPELMVLSVGAGSLMCSHVNDTGFWMFKEYFGLSLGDTFRTWTVMETIVGVVGLLGVLVLDLFI